MVPPESTISSIRTQGRPSTSPMMFITSDSPARSRRLSTMARSVPSRRARARARTTPPTSGDTTISQANYEVGDDLHARFGADDAGFFAPSDRAGHFRFDLPGYVRKRLALAGGGRG